MRQAGRYLPEYRRRREIFSSFGSTRSLRPKQRCSRSADLDSMRQFCFPTFSWFRMLSGSRSGSLRVKALDPMGERKSLARLRTELDHEMLAPIYQTIERVKAEQGPFCETVSGVAPKRRLSDCNPRCSELAGPHIIQDRAARTWLGEDGGWTELLACLNSNSQPAAELLVLLLETSHCLNTVLFKENLLSF